MKNKLLFLGLIVAFLVAHQPVQAVFFTDVSPNHQNFVSITYLSEQGILNGFSDGSFRPDQELKRAEALKILVLGSTIEPDGIPSSNPFPDVDRGSWYAPYVQKGKDLGVIKGNAQGYFEPSRSVNRAEALKMAIKVNGIELKVPSKTPYLDVNVNSWYAPYFSFAKTNNFFDDPSYARPSEYITRGELAELFYRLEKWKENDHHDEGRASYYADFFEGRKTANGEIFNHNAYSAAHQTFAFGTKLLVTNLEDNKSVVVYVNDRGPYAEGNIIDLTKTAFQKIAPLSRGVVDVRLTEMPADTPLGATDESSCGFLNNTKNIPKDFFKGVVLDFELPTIYRQNEIFKIRGTLSEDNEYASVLLNGKSITVPTQNRRFSIPVIFSEVGELEFGVFPGKSGSTFVEDIIVFEPSCEPSFAEQSASTPTDLVVANKDGEAILSWSDDWNNFFQVRFTQGEKMLNFYVNRAKSFTPPPALFADFEAGLLKVEVWGAPLDDYSSVSQTKRFQHGASKDIFVSKHYERTIDENINNLILPNEFVLGESIQISGETSEKLRENATLIAPNGEIFDLALDFDEGKFDLNYITEQAGTYIVEINKDSGLALINTPVLQEGFVPLLPNLRESADQEVHEEIKLDVDRRILLNLINKSRAKVGLNKVELDENINALAQFRADDMYQRKYFGHVDPSGQDANDYRVDHAVKVGVSENIALDINLPLVHEGLMASPIHRRNTLDANWTKVGLGLTKRDSGEIIAVELFAEDAYNPANLPEYREQVLAEINNYRENSLVPKASLEAIAQTWSDKMRDENFSDFTDSKGDTVEDLIREAGINERITILIINNNNFNNFLDSLKDYNNIFAEDWRKIGTGISVDVVGNLFIALIFSE